MFRSIHKSIKQLGVILMILVITALLVNKAVYIHVHVMPDGTVLTHAHPFNKTADSTQGKSHHHSNLELFMLLTLEILILSSAMVLALMIFSQAIENRWFIEEYDVLALIPISLGRAPPHCI